MTIPNIKITRQLLPRSGDGIDLHVKAETEGRAIIRTETIHYKYIMVCKNDIDHKDLIERTFVRMEDLLRKEILWGHSRQTLAPSISTPVAPSDGGQPIL